MNDVLTKINNEKKLIGEINEILKNNGISQQIQYGADVIITDNSITDIFKPHQPLSQAIVDKIWKRQGSKSLYHFTSPEIAEKILNSNKFRLYSLLKRSKECELEEFVKNHSWEWMFKDISGVPSYEANLMNKMFYSSFTDLCLTKAQKMHFKKDFGLVRLKFKVTAEPNTDSNFRKMWYPENEGGAIPVLDEIRCCVDKYGKIFLFANMPRMSAFYLPNKFSIENEYRILYRDFSKNNTGQALVEGHQTNNGWKFSRKITPKIGYFRAVKFG